MENTLARRIYTVVSCQDAIDGTKHFHPVKIDVLRVGGEKYMATGIEGPRISTRHAAEQIAVLSARLMGDGTFMQEDEAVSYLESLPLLRPEQN